MGRSLQQLYFNYLYMPLYDLTTAQLGPYKRLQQECLSKLLLNETDSLLCVGVGTGCELIMLLEDHPDVNIKAVDMTPKALQRAQSKTRKLGKSVRLLEMDAHKLEFEDASFDAVVCIHVMGFLENDRQATAEIRRVLKPQGEYVITYPSGAGGWGVAREIGKDIWSDLKQARFFSALRQYLAMVAGGIVYLPGASWVKPNPGFYTRESLIKMLSNAGLTDCRIEHNYAYQDFVVYGNKHNERRG